MQIWKCSGILLGKISEILISPDILSKTLPRIAFAVFSFTSSRFTKHIPEAFFVVCIQNSYWHSGIRLKTSPGGFSFEIPSGISLGIHPEILVILFSVFHKFLPAVLLETSSKRISDISHDCFFQFPPEYVPDSLWICNRGFTWTYSKTSSHDGSLAIISLSREIPRGIPIEITGQILSYSPKDSKRTKLR